MVKGKRIKVPQWIEGVGPMGPFVVRIDADAVIPDAEPSEPCFEPPTMKMLEEAQKLADRGELDALSKMGSVFVRRSA